MAVSLALLQDIQCMLSQRGSRGVSASEVRGQMPLIVDEPFRLWFTDAFSKSKALRNQLNAAFDESVAMGTITASYLGIKDARATDLALTMFGNAENTKRAQKVTNNS